MLDGLSKLIDATAKLAGVLVWPGLIIFILIKGKTEIFAFFYSLSELTIKYPGGEASFRRVQAKATAELVAASVARIDDKSDQEVVAEEARAAAEVVRSISPNTIRRANRSKILWVDDRPQNNTRERKALETLGIEFTTSTSTEDAMQILTARSFDAVISDMGRPGDPKAGFTLLKAMRDASMTMPYIIYAGSRASEHLAEARRNGALGCTSRPDELFQYVLDALGRNR